MFFFVILGSGLCRWVHLQNLWHCLSCSVQSPLSMNLAVEKKSRLSQESGFKPRTTGWEARTLPLCYAAPPPKSVFFIDPDAAVPSEAWPVLGSATSWTSHLLRPCHLIHQLPSLMSLGQEPVDQYQVGFKAGLSSFNFFTPIPHTYTGSSLDGMARNFYYFYLHGYARTRNLRWLDPFYSFLLIPEERRKTFGLKWNPTQVLLPCKRPL